jgi:hypothetical protein
MRLYKNKLMICLLIIVVVLSTFTTMAFAGNTCDFCKSTDVNHSCSGFFYDSNSWSHTISGAGNCGAVTTYYYTKLECNNCGQVDNAHDTHVHTTYHANPACTFYGTINWDHAIS